MSVIKQSVFRQMVFRLGFGLLANIVMAAEAADSALPMPSFNTAQLEQERKHFIAARDALARGDMDVFNLYLERLHDYPLHMYLRYENLRTALLAKQDVSAEVRDYLADYPRHWLAERLRQEWLRYLAEQTRWRELLLFALPTDSDELRCLTLQARLAMGDLSGFDRESRAIWVRNTQLPRTCEAVYQVLEARDHPTPDMVWERLELAMEQGRTILAHRLAELLPTAERPWFELWERAYREPAAVLQEPRLQQDKTRGRQIFTYALKRYAQTDLVAAYRIWQEHKTNYGFDEAQLGEIERGLAIRAVVEDLPLAVDWLGAIPKAQQTERTLELAALEALRTRDWAAVRRIIQSMPAPQRSDPRWQYWLAQTYIELNEAEFGKQLFGAIAGETSYYGFLAADRVMADYRINHEPAAASLATLASLRAMPEISRVHEYRAVGLFADAWREWLYLIAAFDTEWLRAAATLASQANWHDFAISTIAKTGERNDYHLRFPLAFAVPVLAEAEARQLEPAFVFGVIRRESAYRVDARSPAGALGLMQLMPGTATQIARSLGQNFNPVDLFDGDLNIRFGAQYLRQTLDRFAQHQVLALAAYNAGPRKVAAWLPREQAVPADWWVETLPYRETRDYIQAVLAYATIFDWRMRGPTRLVSLRERMPPIAPLPTAATAKVCEPATGTC